MKDKLQKFRTEMLEIYQVLIAEMQDALDLDERGAAERLLEDMLRRAGGHR